MDALRKQKFNQAMFSKNRTLAIRVGKYQSSDIKEASFDYGYIKGDTYKPGGTCAGSAKIVFTSVITTFNKLDKVYPEIGLLVDGTYEWVKMGEYFINDIEIDRNRNTTKLDLMDGMFKLNREHITDLTYPAEIRHVIKEICLKTGIDLANENMDITSMNYRIEQIPKDKKMTFRDVLSLATQMLGMSCFFNREGKLEIKELTDSGITITADSYFMHGLTKSEIEYQIAGITCKKDKETLTVGLRTGRSLELDNLFMSQAILDNLYHKIKDIRYYPFNLNYQGHLLLNVGEWVTIKTNTGETFKSPVLSQSFTFKGGLRGRISADSKAGNDAQYSYAGTITKKIVQFNEFEAQIQNQIEEADKGFDQKVAKIKKDFSDQVELAKAKAEEVKQELSDTIDQRFNSFNNGPLQEAKRRAEEALRNAGASSLLAQEAKRIGLDSIAKLDAFKRQATSVQTALSGDLDVLKRTIANDIRPKQAQAEAEISKQVEALIQTKKELAGVKSAQATYEETTTRRLSELTNLANGKASKSELTQTAEQLASKIASVQVGSSRNYFRNSRSRTFTTGDQATYDYRTFIVPDFWKNGDRFKRDYVRISFDATFPVALANDTQANVHFSAHPWYGYKLTFKGGTTERQHFEFTIDLSGSSETYQTNNVFIRFGTNYGFPAALQVVIENAMLSVGNYFPAYQPAYEDQEDRVSTVESSFKQRADSLDAGVSRLTEGLRTKADISSLNVTAENIRQSVKSLETSTQNKLDKKLSMAEFEVRASGIRQEIVNATKNKADKTLVVAEAGKIREEFSKMKVGSRNYAEDYDFSRGLWHYSQGDNSPQDWTISNGEYNVKGTTNTWKQMQIHSKEGSRSSWKSSTALLDLEVGETYTLSFQGICYSGSSNVWVSLRANRTVPGNPEIINGNFNLTSSWQTYQVTISALTKPDNFDFWRIILGYDGIGHVAFRKVELTRSSTRIDAGPAPEDGKTDLVVAKSEFQKTAEGLSAKLETVETYVSQDGQRQEALRKYSRDESARQVSAVRELITRDYVGKVTYQEDVRGINQRIEEARKNASNELTTRLANYRQTVDGKFTDISSQVTTYKQVADSQISNLSNRLTTEKQGTDSKIANLTNQVTTNKASSANQFANVANQLAKKVEVTDFQKVKETSQLYERILGNTENGIADNVARMTLTNQLFQVEVSKNEGLKTVQRQLAGSWGVHNKNSVNEIIAGFNLAGKNAGIKAETIRLEGRTLLDELTAIQGYFKRLFVGEGTFATLNTDILRANSITADKLIFDQAMANKFTANNLLADSLFSKQAFVNRVQSVTLDASQIKTGVLTGGRIQGSTIIGSSISGGTITGSSISGATLTGHTKIQLGSYGSFDTVNGGLQINVPRTIDSKDGLGVQFIGSYGRGENVPYGLFIYKDSDFTTGGYASQSDEFLLTVAGYVNAKGIGWLKTGKGSVNGKITGTIGLWNSENVSLDFGGSGNDIYYTYNGTAYSLWEVINQHFSDRHLKENIVDCKHKALDYIHQLQFKEYDWKKKEDRPQQAHTKIGLIAQEVQEVDPTLVYENGDTLNLDNLRLTNIALKAIQELSQRIETLERKLA